MNRGPLLFLGLFAAFASAFAGLILAPQLQIGRQAARVIESTDQLYPTKRPGQAAQGLEVYRSLGCAECHSQQVRGYGGDLDRGWGKRISVAQDFLYDSPVMLGSLRAGPDLANVGARKPDATWHLLHLYNPKVTVPGSPMPRYPFLFEKRKLRPGQPGSPEALPVKELKGTEGQETYEIIPKPSATALVAYLLNLQAEISLFEAPIPLPKTNAPLADASATNAGSATNIPAASVTDTNAATSAPPPAPVK